MIEAGMAYQELGRMEKLDDAAFDPAKAALLVAQATRPTLKLEPYYRHIQKLKDETLDYIGNQPSKASINLRIEALIQVTVRRYGYGGSEEVEIDPDGADLARVIDARCGSSEALAIIFLSISRPLNWPSTAVGLPGRVMVRLNDSSERKIIDPMSGGKEMTPEILRGVVKALSGLGAELGPGQIQELGNRDICNRLIDRRKDLLLKNKQFEDALKLLEVSILLSPNSIKLWHEYGLLNARLDYIDTAVESLEKVLKLQCGEDTRYKTSVLLKELRARQS